MSADLLSKGQSLCSALKADGPFALNEQISKLISDCKAFVDVAETLDDSMTEVKEKMESLREEIRGVMQEKAGTATFDALKQFLDKQWVTNVVDADPEGSCFNLLEATELAPIEASLQLRGLEQGCTCQLLFVLCSSTTTTLSYRVFGLARTASALVFHFMFCQISCVKRLLDFRTTVTLTLSCS